jgi:hypothetical protein
VSDHRTLRPLGQVPSGARGACGSCSLQLAGGVGGAACPVAGGCSGPVGGARFGDAEQVGEDRRGSVWARCSSAAARPDRAVMPSLRRRRRRCSVRQRGPDAAMAAGRRLPEARTPGVGLRSRPGTTSDRRDGPAARATGTATMLAAGRGGPRASGGAPPPSGGTGAGPVWTGRTSSGGFHGQRCRHDQNRARGVSRHCGLDAPQAEATPALSPGRRDATPLCSCAWPWRGGAAPNVAGARTTRARGPGGPAKRR